MLSFPDEYDAEQQYHRPDRADRVEDVRNTHRVDPWNHGEDEDRAQQVAGECQGDESVADDLDNKLEVGMMGAVLWLEGLTSL